MDGSSTNAAVLQTTRTYPCPADKIYQAFADPERLVKWWGPNGFSNTFETFEFTEGGEWRYTMHSPDGQDFKNVCVFVELITAEKLVIKHDSAPRFTLTITLEESTNQTLLTWTQKFEDPQVADAVRHLAEPGNEQNLDRLGECLNGSI